MLSLLLLHLRLFLLSFLRLISLFILILRRIYCWMDLQIWLLPLFSSPRSSLITKRQRFFPLENYRKIGRFAQSGLRDCLKKKFVGSNFEDATFFTTVIFFFSFVLVAFKVIGSMESHRSERSTRRSMHELLAIRWKSRNQISRNQFLTYSRFFCRNVMKTVSTNGFIPFGCFAGFYFFAFETGPNAAALVATIFLPCILYACRSIQKTVVIFKQHSVFLSYSFRLLNGTLNDNFFRWKGK